MANPFVTVANMTVIDMTARFHLPGRKDHETFAGSMLYTDQEVKQYSNLLHFQSSCCRGHGAGLLRISQRAKG